MVELPSLLAGLVGGDAVDIHLRVGVTQPTKRTCRNRSVAGSNPARPTKPKFYYKRVLFVSKTCFHKIVEVLLFQLSLESTYLVDLIVLNYELAMCSLQRLARWKTSASQR